MRLIGVVVCVFSIPCAGAGLPPTIDGFLDDPFWANNARVWTTYGPDLPDYSARFQIGFDDRAIYFSADVTDPDLTGNREKLLDDITGDDAVQLFLDVGDTTSAEYAPDVYRYDFSVAGAVNWQRIDGTSEAQPESRPSGWESGLRRAVTLKPGTTLNQHNNRDNGYIVEAAIPWANLQVRQPPDADRTIGVCFVNVFKGTGGAEGTGAAASAPAGSQPTGTVPRLWQRIRTDLSRPLSLRGLTESLPLWLGTTMYANQWRSFASAETDEAGAWLNRSVWQAKFDRMASMGYNALLLLHPHPYSGLLPLDTYPGACYFAPEALQRHIEHFRWLLAEGRKRRIRIYVLTWNICLPPRWAKANNLGEFGADTPLARAYTRSAVRDLFLTYPDLAGLATMAAESPPGCADFVADAICGGINEARAALATRPSGSPPSPELIFWNWCSYPEDVRQVMAAYPNTRLMDYLQYEQWFKPMVDPRVARFATWATAAPLGKMTTATTTFTLGGPKSALGYLFWGDPDWLRQLTSDLRRQGVDGLFFEPYCSESWLAQEAFAYYASNPTDQYDPKKWTQRLDEVYGVGAHAGQLLEAMQHASAIMPRFITLVHSQSDHYLPQFGLPLAYYLHMPTLSSYVYENTQTLDDRGYLTPRLGLTWPNPDWGEQVAGIRDQARKAVSPGTTLPTDIAREIELRVIACRSRLTALRQVKPQSSDQSRRLADILDRLELNAALGEHFQEKIQAALAWERLKAGEARVEDCTAPLERSVQAWQTVSEITGRLYPRPVRHWQSQIVSPPPWTQNQIWHSYRLVEGHWHDQLPRFQRELTLVRQSLLASPLRANLPMWDHLNAAPEEDLISICRISFQNETAAIRRIALGPGASITDDPSLAPGEGRTLLADTRTLGDGPHEVLTTTPTSVPLNLGTPYQIAVLYRVLDRGTAEGTPFEIGVRPAKGGPLMCDHRLWDAPAGHLGTRVLQVPPLGEPDHVFSLIIHGRAAIAIDLINVQARKTP